VSFDNSRFTFDPFNDYSGVVMQQGRVQLDSDWNEWLAELSRRLQAGTLDAVGRAAYPATTPYAFYITATSSGGTNSVTIGPGRMYVDGLLAENHGARSTAVWDPALAELSNAPQPPPASETGAISYTEQPYLPNPPTITGTGPFLAYLDVWTRPVTYLEDSNLIDKAVGVDTTGRLQTVWQVKLMPVPAGTTCSSSIAWPASSAGLLTTGLVNSMPSGPCCLTSGTGYTGQENQLYRVEIHQSGVPAAAPAPSPLPGTTATFKWSRENGSVQTGVTAIASATNSIGNPASRLTVLSLGRDQVLGFANGDWIEILDDSLELSGLPGELHQIDTVDFSAKTITLVSSLSATFPTDTASNTRIVRWDQSGTIYLQDGVTVWWDLTASGSGDIPVPPSGTVLILENGITVAFDVSSSGGSFLTGDFWTFAARTADGSIESLTKAPPRGIYHHYARLSLVGFSPLSNNDCRTPWPSGGSGECGCCCTVTAGEGGQYSSIQEAIQALPGSGGEVCILPGRYFEHVFIEGRDGVVLRGCGWQTLIASPSLNPSAPPPAAGTSSSGTIAAVVTVSGSRHIQLQSFVVEADSGEVGVLLDGTGEISASPAPVNQPPQAATLTQFEERGVIDTTIEDLVIAASDRPGILAYRVNLLDVEKNRIAVRKDVRSIWPAVWVSGSEIRITHNWVGMRETLVGFEWLPEIVATDFAASSAGSKIDSGTNLADPFPPVAELTLNPGGIQVAGPSHDVFILENIIENAGHNGITLGSFTVLDSTGKDTGLVTGVATTPPDACTTTIGLQPGGLPPSAPQGASVVAGGKLLNIQIDRNVIRDTGLCGIGPVGFFDLLKILEIISIENLTISSNTILNTLQGELEALSKENSLFGYGAICLPDVENLVIRDNAITNFGSEPGLNLCGIFILHGEMVEISRNQVLETRDWTTETKERRGANVVRGGIWVALATPPSFTVIPPYIKASTLLFEQVAVPLYEPGLPALRVEHNVVRVPLGETFLAWGFGPFAIVNNHFTCGGTVKDTGIPLAQTVLILNLGGAIESIGMAGSYSSFYDGVRGNASTLLQTRTELAISSGAVIFTNNACQLEALGIGQRALTNVLIFSLDYLNFSDNHCWVDGRQLSAFLDALLLAGSIQVNSNRFQESPAFAVVASGVTAGALNVTTGNISTYCLFVEGAQTANANNLSVIPAALCPGSLQG
jgi:hypothetical protein